MLYTSDENRWSDIDHSHRLREMWTSALGRHGFIWHEGWMHLALRTNVRERAGKARALLEELLALNSEVFLNSVGPYPLIKKELNTIHRMCIALWQIAHIAQEARYVK